MVELSKYSVGAGNRFTQQAAAQLQAFMTAREAGVEVVPVWNKSHREHTIIGSKPSSVRRAAEDTVKQLNWAHAYHVDADHIGLGTVDRFVAACDFFTIDVADFIGQPTTRVALEEFVARHPELARSFTILRIDRPFEISHADLLRVASQYLLAVQEAGKVYRHITALKEAGTFIAEISMDETDTAQTPPELLIILAAVSDESIPIQTIAPKFTGRFNKGVDYVGGVDVFAREFDEHLCVLAHAVKTYGIPSNLKLSVHSGSDKFSRYGPMKQALRRRNAGLHLKTAGTTWLEEVIGLAEADGSGLVLAKEIYCSALEHIEELSATYASVIDIDRSQLPPAAELDRWDSRQFVQAVRHNPTDPHFHPHIRQLLHVAFKIAARMGSRYLEQLHLCKDSVSRNVTTNLLERHIKPLFL